MAYKAHGIVVGVKNWGEADKRVSFFTEERGRIPALAFGCRRPKSPLAASLQLFFVLELDLVAGKRVDTVRQAQIITRPKKMRETSMLWHMLPLLLSLYGTFCRKAYQSLWSISCC